MYKILFLFCCLLSMGAYSAPFAKAVVPKVKTTPKVLSTDSSAINVRKFDAKALDKYQKDPDFDYDSDVTKSESLWTRFWRWFWEVIEKLFGHRETSNNSPNWLGKYLIVIIGVGLIIFIIVKIVGVENIFSRQSKSVDLPYSESLENIHEISFDEEIDKAIATRNYRLAVRLLYLRSLKQLNDARLIQWQIEKTNSTYINELADTGQKQTFGVLTRQFEYVWYGDFPIDETSFRNIGALFNDFKKML